MKTAYPISLATFAFVVIIAVLAFANQVFAVDTAATSPGTTADDATVGTLAWSNTDNVKVSDDVYATRTTTLSGSITHYLTATNFGFAIPAGATINGLTVEVDRKRTGAGNLQDSAVRIIKGGSIGATNKASASTWPTTEATATYGSASDLWGDTWTADDINSSNFGMAIATVFNPDVSITASIDNIRITVSYTVAATPQHATVLLGTGTTIFGGGTTIIP